MILGVTGGSGSGKSAFCRELAQNGAYVLDADVIAREVVMPKMPALAEIKEEFGPEYLTSQGELDRKKMAACVFSDEKKLHRLNQITHKYIIAEIKRLLSEHRNRFCVIDAPLLFESNLDQLCDRTVGILSEKEERVERIVSRDGLTQAEAHARVEAQATDEYYILRADDIIKNHAGAEISALAQNYWMALEKK